MMGKKAASGKGFGTQDRPIEVSEGSIGIPMDTSDKSVEILSNRSVETLVLVSDESMEEREEEEEECYPSNPELVRKDDIGIDPWQYPWQTEESLSSDRFEFSISSWGESLEEDLEEEALELASQPLNLEDRLPREELEEIEIERRDRKGKMPMEVEELKQKRGATKEKLLGAARNPLLYFSNKKGPTQRAWEGKIPPWMQKVTAADEKKAVDEDEESGGSDD